MTGKPTIQLPSDYADWLANLKQRIQGARQRALLSANAEQIRLYHEIGRDILERQGREGWGAKVIDRLSSDLRASFPGMKGLSSRNLKYMKVFAEHCPDRQFVQQSAAQIPQIGQLGQQTAAQLSPSDPIGQETADQLPWFHIVILLTKLTEPVLREWYAREAIRQAWPRDTLIVQIKNQLHLRQGLAVTNFDQRLTPPQAGLATEILKDPYHFDFLGLGDEAHERDIENALVRHITRFLLELGSGFAFVGRQVQLIVGGEGFFSTFSSITPASSATWSWNSRRRPSSPSTPDSSISTSAPSMRRSKPRTTNPPSASCSAAPKTGSSLSMPFPASTSPLASPNTSSSAPCPSRSIRACRASRKSKPNSRSTWKRRTNHETRLQTD